MIPRYHKPPPFGNVLRWNFSSPGPGLLALATTLPERLTPPYSERSNILMTRHFYHTLTQQPVHRHRNNPSRSPAPYTMNVPGAMPFSALPLMATFTLSSISKKFAKPSTTAVTLSPRLKRATTCSEKRTLRHVRRAKVVQKEQRTPTWLPPQHSHFTGAVVRW
jgi:hypothetical protein